MKTALQIATEKIKRPTIEGAKSNCTVCFGRGVMIFNDEYSPCCCLPIDIYRKAKEEF